MNRATSLPEDRNGVLMQGIGRWLVFSRPRAWLGRVVEVPNLLRGVRVPRGACCLDIATGLGWASAGLARLDSSARLVVLDYDGTILPRTRDYLKSHVVAASAALCRADAKRLPFRDGSFDLAICLYGLHHFRGYYEALREIARVLKPGATFALIDPVRGSDKPPGGHHGTEVLTSEELDRMLGAAGFEFLQFQISLRRAKAVMRKSANTNRVPV
jgi:ubiquinone/menaquinone biosynthesis C-methylase UbiE